MIESPRSNTETEPAAPAPRPAEEVPPAGLRRWWVYQRERFPVLTHGLLIAAFSFSALSFSSLLRGRDRLPPPGAALVAFLTAFLFFLQLRIADEFKDFEEDSRFRPYRPVPRGLVSLRELGVLGALAALVQLGLALWLDPSLVLLLAVAWAYLVLMSKEFFVAQWLKARPVAYMVSHMVIIPTVGGIQYECTKRGAGRQHWRRCQQACRRPAPYSFTPGSFHFTGKTSFSASRAT
jgi:4-hydroxybenzoate polyprenyltransferase